MEGALGRKATTKKTRGRSAEQPVCAASPPPGSTAVPSCTSSYGSVRRRTTARFAASGLDPQRDQHTRCPVLGVGTSSEKFGEREKKTPPPPTLFLHSSERRTFFFHTFTCASPSTILYLLVMTVNVPSRLPRKKLCHLVSFPPQFPAPAISHSHAPSLFLSPQNSHPGTPPKSGTLHAFYFGQYTPCHCSRRPSDVAKRKDYHQAAYVHRNNPTKKMSEAVLKNIEKELPKLQAELVKMKEAAPKSEALVDLITYIAKTPEPFYGNAPPNNPWLKPTATPCCTVS